MNVGFLYLLTNPKHASRLVVSIASLRNWFGGPICICTTRPESHEIAHYCCRDPRLRTDHIRIWERKAKRQEPAFLTKTIAISNSPYPATVFLDADTLVVGDISRLVESAQEAEVTATIFHNWRSTDQHLSEMLESWRVLQGTKRDTFGLRKLIDNALRDSVPGINAGVVAMQPRSKILKDWHELTYLGRKRFLPDEIALQLLLQKYPHRLLDTRYNCHPSADPNIQDVRIWHYAGSLHMHDWGPGRRHWIPAYQECQRLNMANINAWSRIEVWKAG